jgi:hypothetical protein
MTKKLDTTTIQRDLEGSAFFPKTTTPLAGDNSSSPPSPLVEPAIAPPAPSAAQGVRPVRPVRPVRRKIRHAFDIHEDQIDSLRQLSYEARLRGEEGSMSAMVRSALDEYIGKMEKQK